VPKTFHSHSGSPSPRRRPYTKEMRLSSYLPSAQFALIVGSLLASGGLVVAAQYVTKQPTVDLSVAKERADQQTADWQQSLEDIQNASGISLPEAPKQETVDALLKDAETSNLTTSIGRSLLIKLSNAKAQGLGDDIPTQDQLVSDAAAKVGASITPSYTLQDLSSVPQTKDSLYTYGNAVMEIMGNHPQASYEGTLYALGYATDYNDKSKLGDFAARGAAYTALAKELAAIDVPSALRPLHLVVVNDMASSGKTFSDMATLLEDPLRGLGGLQQYQSYTDEAHRVLTTIAENLNKNGILFSKDEPGSAWSALLSTSAQ
jgi:hypothetical protein